MGNRRNSISVIWSGEEADLQHQMEYIEREASLNNITRLFWKDHTPHERLCQYVGKPIDPTSRTTLKGKWNRKSKKYALLEDLGYTENFLMGLVGKPFNYYTTEKEDVKVENAFAKIAEGESIYWGDSKEFTKLSDLEKYVEDLNDNAPDRVKYELKVREHYKHKGCYEGTVECSTEHDGVIQPWAMLRDDSVMEAWHEVTDRHGINTRDLEQRESELIPAYNDANNRTGRQRRPWDKAKWIALPQHIKDAMDERDTIERELSDVRSDLGKAKRKVTNLTKKQGGLELDLTKYCITNQGGAS